MKKYEELVISFILMEEEIVRTSDYGEGNDGGNNLPWVDVTSVTTFA